MQISQYISDLLYRYECVILPNFGAFLSHPISARINEATNDFYPPQKQLSFNAQLKSNDGLLASYISELENISFEGATRKIEQQVSQIKSRLDKGNTVEFKHVGVLSFSEEGKLLFVPSESLNYMTEAFGLASFVSPSVERQAHQTIALAPRRRQTAVFMKYAAIAILTLGLGGSIGSNLYLTQIEQQNSIALDNANTTLHTTIQEATFVIDNPLPAVMVNLKKQSGDFHVVAGAFRVKANSERKLQQLKTLGYNARLIGVNRYGLHQVVYESFDSRKEAEKALFKIRNTQDRAAWLLIKNIP
jgi:hypothetical protein